MSMRFEGPEQRMPAIKRAAFVVEHEDGTRVIYEFQPMRGVTIATDYNYEDIYSDHMLARPVLESIDVTIKGTMSQGMAFTGDFPQNRPQLRENMGSIEGRVEQAAIER